MRLLLHTHAFLWFIAGDNRLDAHAKALIEERRNERLLSVGSLWEISIKVSLDRIVMRRPFAEFVSEQVDGNDIRLLPILPDHLDKQISLPFHHRDPFDRLIISQSLVERIPVITRDQAFSHYPVDTIWRRV